MKDSAYARRGQTPLTLGKTRDTYCGEASTCPNWPLWTERKHLTLTNKSVEIANKYDQRTTATRVYSERHKGIVIAITDAEAQVMASQLLDAEALQRLLRVIDEMYPEVTASFVASKVKSNIFRSWGASM